jgi:ketosteroid isomerase-like protein
MIALLVAVPLAAALAQQPPGKPPLPSPEAAVSGALEELRKGELFLDADALADYVAASFTVIDEGARISGSFAYLEPIRRMRERGAKVTELRFEEVAVRVYGASAVASYRFTKAWQDRGVRHRQQGWSSDVFELRDDGRWIMVHRHRSR